MDLRAAPMVFTGLAERMVPPATRSWRLKCADAQLEDTYRRWRADRAVPFARAGMLASVLGWAVVAVASVWVGPHLSRLTIPATLLIVTPLALALVALTYVPALRAWILPSVAALNLVGGVIAVKIVELAGREIGEPSAYADLGTVGVILFVYYGCTIMRLPPMHAVLAMTPYVVLQQVLVIQGFGHDTARLIVYSTLLWVAIMSGLLLSFVLERVSRRTFAQERMIEAQGEVIERERERAERLLLGILPAPIAERLKAEPGVIAESHDDVSVLFVDLVGFTPLASQTAPKEVVSLLNEVFSRFDDLTARFGVEKIKTIGDAYMAAAGLPEPREDHVQAAADLALEMRAAVRDVTTATGQPLDVRIGLHTGPVIAGVIGTTKFAYDLWGDVVNVAARLESQGLPGHVNVSDEVARRLTALGYRLRERGMVDLKGRGPTRTWLLTGRPYSHSIVPGGLDVMS